MDKEDMYLVEVFYKIPHKRKRVFSYISKNSSPAPAGYWDYIERGIEAEFGRNQSWMPSSLEFVVTYLPDQ